MGWWREERDGCGMVSQPGVIEGSVHYILI